MMTENTDELICPITLELFRDPVRATDGHVYERQAITKWILEHGTSPLTRQPLQINDLQTDEHLTNLARQRRNSTVSYNSQNQRITLPPLRRIPRRIVPADIQNPVRRNYSSNKHCWAKIFVISMAFVIPISVILAIYLFIKDLQSNYIYIYRI
jgi:hypothetical protein